ncbi:hypothetical protein [Nonomuraea sp. NPDC049028]|uniref:hypothetical protein n=1 Tax=Nonomuraea sp. NPDC049028 TaxID=3364348 RepID=UPI003723A198
MRPGLRGGFLAEVEEVRVGGSDAFRLLLERAGHPGADQLGGAVRVQAVMELGDHGHPPERGHPGQREARGRLRGADEVCPVERAEHCLDRSVPPVHGPAAARRHQGMDGQVPGAFRVSCQEVGRSGEPLRMVGGELR